MLGASLHSSGHPPGDGSVPILLVFHHESIFAPRDRSMSSQDSSFFLAFPPDPTQDFSMA